MLMARVSAARKEELSNRLAPYRWQPGQSGNVLGVLARPEYIEVVRLARANSIAAIERLLELMQSDDDRVSIVASQAVLERAWGKPKEMTEDKPPLDVSRLTEPQRAKLKAILTVMVGCDV